MPLPWDTGGGRQPVGRVVTAVDDGPLDLTHFSFLPALLEVGVLVPFLASCLVVCWIIWRYEKRIDVICKYYLAVVITRRNYYG